MQMHRVGVSSWGHSPTALAPGSAGREGDSCQTASADEVGRLGPAGAGCLLGWITWCRDPGGQGWKGTAAPRGEPIGSCLLFVSAAFLGTRRAVPHLLLLLRASSACGGGRPSGERAAPF